VDATRLLVLAATQAEIDAEPADAHAPDRVVAAKEMAVRELVEDELILALPYAPRHEDCERATAARRRRISPFAACAADARQALNDLRGVRTWQSIRTRSRRRARTCAARTTAARAGDRDRADHGETHLRHHVSPTGFYRGKKVVKTKDE
jgi:ribosomal protein L32